MGFGWDWVLVVVLLGWVGLGVCFWVGGFLGGGGFMGVGFVVFLGWCAFEFLRWVVDFVDFGIGFVAVVFGLLLCLRLWVGCVWVCAGGCVVLGFALG